MKLLKYNFSVKKDIFVCICGEKKISFNFLSYLFMYKFSNREVLCPQHFSQYFHNKSYEVSCY